MINYIIGFTLGLQVGVVIGILWELRRQRLFREMVNKLKELR
jgi:hypothetical protein